MEQVLGLVVVVVIVGGVFWFAKNRKSKPSNTGTYGGGSSKTDSNTKPK